MLADRLERPRRPGAVAAIGDGHRGGVRAAGRGRARRPAAAHVHHRRAWRGRSRAARAASSARAPTSRPRGWRTRSPRRAGRPSASTPTGRVFPRSLPAEAREALAAGRGRRRHVHERLDRARVRRRARRGAGRPEGRVHRPRHREGGARPRLRRCTRSRGPHTTDGLVAALERARASARAGRR